MTSWPDCDGERQADALLRADLYEGRYLAAGEHHKGINLLLQTAASAYLLGQEPEGDARVARAGRRMAEWVAAVQAGRTPASLFRDLAAARGLLTLALLGDDAIVTQTAQTFLALTATAPPGAVHNARLAAAALLGLRDAMQVAAGACELSDAGLGAPWRRFALAIEARDPAVLARHIQTWLREKEEATRTSEWGDYDDVPIEVSAALALAERSGVPVRVATNRVLPRFRA